jgi:hypothetical protein
MHIADACGFGACACHAASSYRLPPTTRCFFTFMEFAEVRTVSNLNLVQIALCWTNGLQVRCTHLHTGNWSDVHTGGMAGHGYEPLKIAICISAQLFPECVPIK